MTAVAAPEEAPAVPARSALDRVYAAVPLASVFVWLCMLYAWQARNHVSPWEFGDELELTQIARAIAATGHGARRGQPYGFHTLWTFAMAVPWRLWGTGTAYAAIKYLGVLVMTASVFPAYFLARLVASPRASLFAAAAVGAIPSFAYSSMILTEPPAYFWSTLTLFLIARALLARGPLLGEPRLWHRAASVRSRLHLPVWPLWLTILPLARLLATPRGRRLAGAAAAAFVAPLIRSQLIVLPAIYVLAALALAWTSGAARRWRSRWTRRDWLRAALLLAGLVIFANAIYSSRSHEWLIATGYYRGRIVDLGVWAAGAFTIGLGVLPVVAGLSVLFRPRDEPPTPELRVFASVLGAGILAFGLYAGVKAAWISTNFATRIEERNLIYVAPLLLAATALWLDRPRVRLVPLAVAAGFACYCLVKVPYALDNVPYDDAFGLSLVQLANRRLSFADSGVKLLLIGVLVLSVLLLLAPRFLPRRLSGAVVALTAGLVLAWSLAGEIAGSNASNGFSRQVLRNFPGPREWLDRADHATGAIYIGQGITQGQSLGLNLMEFWNRSLTGVWSLDGTAPGPGPTLTPNLAQANGQLYPDPPVDYVVADEGIDLVGTVVATEGRWRVYHIVHPLRTTRSVTGFYGDGWSEATAAYNRYATPGHRAGVLTVRVGRFGANGTPAPPATVTIRLGHLVVGPDHEPALGRVTVARQVVVRTFPKANVVRLALRTPPPPFRVEIAVAKTFRPIDYGRSDPRNLGVQASFGFAASPAS